MYLTETIILNKTKELSELCHCSKNLYNLANYNMRQFLFNLGEIINFYDLYEILKQNPCFKKLPHHANVWVLKNVDSEWKSYWKALKEYKKHPNKFYRKPKLPNYKKKDGEYITIFNKYNTRIKNGNEIHFPKRSNIPPIKTRIINYKLIRIIPKNYYYVCEIIYEKKEHDLNLNKSRILSIDLGVNNLLTTANNIGLPSLIVKGNVVKSVNQWYNKIRAVNRSNVDSSHPETKKMSIQTKKRNNRIKNFFHKTSRKLIDYCITNNIGTIIIGYNKGWKQKINIGKKNNQNFVNIPFIKLIQQIQYKSKLIGIKVILTEESYTSKCSALDNEEIKKCNKYLGKRVKRGLFQSYDGIRINADVNGAINIMRKVIPTALNGKGIEAMVLSPQIIKI